EEKSHPSILKINENQDIHSSEQFQFKSVVPEQISKIIDSFKIKKATGVDKISGKILKLGKPALVNPVTNLVNHTIYHSIFPDDLKRAQVSPIYKKDDPLSKKNHRPVSILPTISKIYERVLSDQLCQYFDGVFDDFLCAFRKGHGCQTVILKLLEDWKVALDKNEYVASILMDLFKAFDCLPHDILLSKLSAYGLDKPSVSLLKSYLSNRKQQIKISNIVSSWSEIRKGVPQGSILGPLLFNVFINDIFYFIKKGTLYNYADDNTLSFSSPNLNILIDTLQNESEILIEWFRINRMQANPDKFQAIAVGKKTFQKVSSFQISNSKIDCQEVVKLLGIDIDYQLKFDAHISNICRKAAQQLNVLRRIGKFLSKLNKMTIFYTFILSNFNYCPLAWHFCSEANTIKLEKIQERALRFVYDDHSSSYEELLQKANIPTLHVRRLRVMALETFKILNNIAPTVLSNLVSLRESKYSFRYSNILQVPQVRTSSFGKNSFKYTAAVLWNSLPEEFRKVNSFNHFRSLISNWTGNLCKCNICR
ncbi:MAG: reverse transcriptase family protein, partial [gamma proteobacterium symbiont of Lucinoma myriamae]|nr:reverse transcriptase family protein [gamma proteobacterium symbiont of Lucinoma myriamae]